MSHHVRVWCGGGCERSGEVPGRAVDDTIIAWSRDLLSRCPRHSEMCDRFSVEAHLPDITVEVFPRETSRAEWLTLLRRDPCAYCGSPTEHLDHIQPRAGGGSDDIDNLTAACAACNISKRDQHLTMFLLRAA